MGEYYKTDTISFPSIVMKQVQIIQQITSKELRDGTRTIVTPIGEQIYENEDTRYSFLQAVETFGSLLSPYFDKDTETQFDNYKNMYDMELIEALDDKEFLKDLIERFNINTQKIKEKIKIDNKLRSELLLIFLNEKCKIARQMCRQLIKCFKSNDYLASESYNEGSSDSNEDADGDDDESVELNEETY